MRSNPIYLVLLAAILISSCRPGARLSSRDDGKIEVDFIQVNDVYEIAPLAGGTMGGIARVATLKKRVRQSNPNSFLVLSGDFLSPSVFNSLRNNGRPIRGEQMVDALNAAGLDIAIFGNHEFDLSEKELQQRIDESRFAWVATNVLHRQGDHVLPFKKTGSPAGFPAYRFLNLKDKDGTSMRIGVLGLTITSNPVGYAQYADPLEAGVDAYNLIKDSCDAVVAITHLPLQADLELARRLPKLAVILGGHEHDMHLVKSGNVYISKAHANAKSAYLVRLQFDTRQKALRVSPELTMLDQGVGLDSATDVVVKKWMDLGNRNYAELGFDARQVLITGGDTLNGLETPVRVGPTNLTDLVGKAIAAAHPAADAVLFNAGSIRLDDMLPPPVTQYDIIRTLPFGGNSIELDITGETLERVLQAGQKNLGSGGYLQTQGVAFDTTTGRFAIKDTLLDTAGVYRIAVNDFLLLGLEARLGFLKRGGPGVLQVYDSTGNGGDIRLSVVKYLLARDKR